MHKILIFSMAVFFAAAPAHAEGNRVTGSLASLLTLGQSQACSFEQPDSKGTVYTAGGRMRGDFIVNDPSAGEMPMHVIRDGEWSYTWGGAFGERQGMKMKVSSASGSGVKSQGPDLDEKVEMDCRPWPVDESMLAVPTDVEFQDMAGMMGLGSGDGSLDINQLKCAACDESGDEESRAQCRQMMGCA